jgi:hypothetical protein
MRITILDRRQFLKTAGRATAAVAVTASGAVSIAATNGAWAMSLNQLDADTAAKLLRMSRLLYPHDWLGDIYYAQAVEALDDKVAKDPELGQMLKTGAMGLDEAMGVPWLELSENYQLEVLEAAEATPFFQTVRGHTVVALYNNKSVWPNFGYQGSSYEFGGYLERGFQDAGWTGDPSPEASPPAYRG